MEPFARDLGYDGPPFIWDTETVVSGEGRFANRPYGQVDGTYFATEGRLTPSWSTR